ncbi:hypothetical protein [Variovorax sp. JS1663]|uniref:hypothetical protein n=1 Tax=Variovorax sp. JS1663 TaxID=1851577 RepID=UPI0018650B86|nr:hypothetical protein [Variovorax sp. JS1663]
MKQTLYVSPVDQVRCVLAVTATSWQVKPRPVRAVAHRAAPPRPPRPDRDRLEEALARGWRWAV